MIPAEDAPVFKQPIDKRLEILAAILFAFVGPTLQPAEMVVFQTLGKWTKLMKRAAFAGPLNQEVSVAEGFQRFYSNLFPGAKQKEGI